MRKLASIQKVTFVRPIEGADAIEKIGVLGWELVAKKGEFKPGDYCVYCEVDSILPEKPEFEFLRPRKFRIKTARMLGEISQGIAFPIDIITGLDAITIAEDIDVTDAIGVTKYEPTPEEDDTGLTVGGLPGRSRKKDSFPGFAHKTDETRIQGCPSVLRDSIGKRLYAAEKLDGSSYTAYLKDGVFGVCSRTQEKAEMLSCVFWNVTRKLDVESKMRAFVAAHPEYNNIYIQGELVGPGIQKNRQGFTEHTMRVFNVADADKDRYFNYEEFINACKEMGLDTVPILDDNIVLTEEMDINWFVTYATRKSTITPTNWAEGVVFRPVVEGFHRKLGRFSFKCINPEYLLKHKL